TYPSSTSQVGACGNYSGWVFGTSRHLGETPIGTWTLRVADRRSGTGSSSGWGNGGTLTSWKIKFYGRAN
ncbi:MAG TPA: proprotein convertase P-domain-containing protein, partial [Leptospiraceae bacterium]|nr:proprotein convertase P-domain-containing protein [Leptospiraceae bacterium]